VNRLISGWKQFRSHFWGALLFDVVLIAGVFFAVHAWQTRDLPIDESAPETVLALLDGSGISNAISDGDAGIVYFFAPWCFYCRKSIDNLDELVSSCQLAWARVVALEYENTDDVREFIKETGVQLPVLLGSAQTTKDWQIRGFPTYFVIDGDGKIVSRSVGYSTKIGLQARVWMNQD